MRMMRSILLGVLIGFLGCAYARVDPGVPHSGARLSASSQVWVLVPSDGAYGNQQYRGSGQTLARRTLSIVRKRHPLAQIAHGSDESEALKLAHSEGIDFIVSPEILHWEDRATPWSGFRDKVRVEVRLLRVHPPKLVSSIVFESRNNSITFIDGRPEDLLDGDYDRAVLGLL